MQRATYNAVCSVQYKHAAYNAAYNVECSAQRTQMHKADIVSIHFSPDDSFILSCASDTEAKLWDLKVARAHGPGVLRVLEYCGT